MTGTASPPHRSRDVGRPGRGHRREHSPPRGEPPGPAGAPGRAVGPGQHPATRGAAHTLASSAPRPAWGAAPPGVWLSPPEQVGVSAASPRPHPRPLLRGVPPPPPARHSPRLRQGLLPFTLDPQPRRCGPGSRPEPVRSLGRGLGALVVTPSGLSVAAASVLCHRRQLGLCAERATLFPAPAPGRRAPPPTGRW